MKKVCKNDQFTIVFRVINLCKLNNKGNKQMNKKFKKLDTDWTNVAIASRIAHKGTHLSKAHKRHIKNGMREFKEAKDGTILEAIKVGEDT